MTFPSSRRPRSSRPARRRPFLEALEDRLALSTLSLLAPKAPLGSLVYESSGSGQVTASTPTDSFSFDLDAGQALSVAVVPSFQFGGHGYTLTSGPLTWQAAEAEAVALGGHLATVNSQAEQDFLTAMLYPGAGQEIFWIGLNDAAVEGTFVWSSGEPVTYTNWYPGEPNNQNDEDYALLYAPPHGWNDGRVTDQRRGIIELPSFTGLRPAVTVSGPGGTLATQAAASPGGTVLLQTIPVATAGTYTVSVAGVSGSTGTFQARVLLNGALEAESFGGADNGTLAAAQDLDAGFLSVGSARQAAATGALPGNTGTTLVSDDFERASLGAGWTTYSSLSTGRIQLTSASGAASGTRALVMDDNKANGAQNLNEAVWTVNLAGLTQAALSFSHASWNDEVAAFAGPFTGHANADGIAISADGTNWYPVWTPPDQAAGVWQPYTIDLAALAAQSGISLGSNFRIKFQQYGANPLPNDGRGWDNLRVLVPGPASTANQDWYRFTLGANEAATVTATPTGNGAVHVRIYDSTGMELATGDPSPTNVGEAAVFTAPAAGTYYARVSGNDFYSTSGVDYVLTVTAGAAFELEDNSGPQLLAANQDALGALQKEPVTAVVPSGSGGLNRPEKLVVHDNYLFVASLITAQVMRYDAATGAPRPSPGNSGAVFATGPMSAPKGVAFGPDGNLYVGDHTNDAIYRFNGTTGAFMGTFVPSGAYGLDRPQGIVFDQAGNLYVSCNFSGLVLRFAPDGSPFPSTDNTGATFATGPGPEERDGATFGPDGNLYVASLGASRVLRFNGVTGAFMDIFVPSISNASDVRFAADGTLHVTSFGGAAVYRFQGPFGPSPGAFLEVAVPPQTGISRLTCLAFGSDGALYIASHDNSSVFRVTGPADFYRVTLQPGDLLTAQTATPFAGPQLPVNNLNPVLRLYDSAGTLLASDDNGMSDLRNARLWYQSTLGGDYYVEVTSGDFSTGEYVLDTAVSPAGSPVLVVDNVTLLEGDSGTTNAQFTVTLLNPSASGDVTVDYTTAGGTALAGSDYTATSGTLTFLAGGPVTQTITVPVTADQAEEAHEYFFVGLSNAAGASVGFDGQARATVQNDDTTVSIGAASTPTYWAVSGHYYTLTSGPLTWQAAEAEAVALGGHLATVNSQAEQDFLTAMLYPGAGQEIFWIGLNDAAVEGTFVWSSGEPVTYTNWYPGEPNNQNDEDYALLYAPPHGWNDGRVTDQRRGIIELPSFTGDVTLIEGNTGTRNATFTLTLSTASALPVSVQYRTDDGAATAASGDYVAVPLTTVTFQPGETVKTITVLVNGDTTAEPNETFLVNLSNATGATIGDGQAIATIANDDAAGTANDVYVWDITHETRRRGGKTDLRVVVTVRRDSDGDGVSESSDAVVSGASVTVQVSGPGSATLSGTTGSNGQFVSGWMSGVANGTYVAEVSQLQSTSMTWNKNLDPTGNDTDLDNDNLPDQQIPVGSALLATSLGANGSGTTLTRALVQPLWQEALARWQAAGADTAALAGVTLRVADLGGLTLGMAAGDTIWLDDDAAGWGWFVDPTPSDDSEFLLAGDQGERGRMDLLTALMHEVGHLLGHDHDDHGVMHETLQAGTREGVSESPTAVIDHAFSAPGGAAAYAPAFWGDVLALLGKRKD